MGAYSIETQNGVDPFLHFRVTAALAELVSPTLLLSYNKALTLVRLVYTCTLSCIYITYT